MEREWEWRCQVGWLFVWVRVMRVIWVRKWTRCAMSWAYSERYWRIVEREGKSWFSSSGASECFIIVWGMLDSRFSYMGVMKVGFFSALLFVRPFWGVLGERHVGSSSG